LTLWVEATDTDLDSTRAIDGKDGPKTGSSTEHYVIIVVPESELLAQIALDEAAMTKMMTVALKKLKEVEGTPAMKGSKEEGLKEILSDLSKHKNASKPEDRLKAENLSPLAIRTSNLDDQIASAHASLKEVLTKYQSLFKELKGNNIQGNKMKTVLEGIIGPLEKLDSSSFPLVHEKMQAFHSDLTAKGDLDEVVARSLQSGEVADRQLLDLIARLDAVLNTMEGEISLNKQIEELREEARRLKQSELILEVLRRAAENKLIGD
jgi:hypothetical protein